MLLSSSIRTLRERSIETPRADDGTWLLGGGATPAVLIALTNASLVLGRPSRFGRGTQFRRWPDLARRHDAAGDDLAHLIGAKDHRLQAETEWRRQPLIAGL